MASLLVALLALAGGCRSSAGAQAVAVGRDAQVTPGADPARPELAGWFVATGNTGRYELAWRPDGGVVPRNQDFALDVLLLCDGVPHAGPRLVVRGSMPDHGHGLVRAPLVTELGQGRYRVEAMLLHMRGFWLVLFDIQDGTTTETVRFELTL